LGVGPANSESKQNGHKKRIALMG